MRKTMSMLVLIAVLAIPAGITGCAGPPRTTEAKVFDTFRTVYNGARQAYASYCELVVQGKVSKENEAKADQAWNDFRAAFTAAVIVANSNWDATSTEQARALAANFLNTLRKLTS